MLDPAAWESSPEDAAREFTESDEFVWWLLESLNERAAEDIESIEIECITGEEDL